MKDLWTLWMLVSVFKFGWILVNPLCQRLSFYFIPGKLKAAELPGAALSTLVFTPKELNSLAANKARY